MAAELVYIDDGYSTSAETLEYRIMHNGTEIERRFASGRDFPIKVYLNRFAQAYLVSSFPEESGITNDLGASGVFSIEDMSGNTLYEKTYVNGYAGRLSDPLSQPINGHLDARMRFFCSVFSESARTIEITTTQV